MHQFDTATTDVVPVYENPIELKDIMQHDVPKKYYLEGETLEKWVYLKAAKNGHKYFFSRTDCIPRFNRLIRMDNAD